MNINELSSYNLADAIKFHNELNPRLWDDREHLHSQIRAKLLDIARDFQEFLGVSNLELEDITVSGSNAAYTYTTHSDIDLHLVVKPPENNNEIYQELFNAKKYQYNDLHNITVGGADVELYVQPADKPPVSLGEYSVLHNKWLHVPKRQKADINQTLVRNKYQTLAAQIESALKERSAKKITALADKIKKMRQSGLSQNGEFGPENLAFKMLRSQGFIDRLHKAKHAARDAELSIDETQQPFRYGFTQSQIDEVGMSPDGVSPDTCMVLDDEHSESELESTLHRFASEVIEELGIERPPEMIFHRGTEWTEQTGSFGQYQPDNNTLQLAVSGRHVLDIIRTMAHELTHCKQSEIGDFPDWAGETGSPWEDQANAMAGRILRGFANEKPELFADVKLEEGSDENDYKEIEFVCVNPKFPDATDPKLQKQMYAGLKKIPNVIPLWQDWGDYSEGQSSLSAIYKNSASRSKILSLAKQLGVKIDLEQVVSDDYVDRAIRGEHEGQQDLAEASGYIPTKAQAKDKRFSTALTVDIHPGQTGKEANKLNLQTDAQGKPALLMRSTNLRESKEKINLDSKLLHLLELIKKHKHEDPHKFGSVAAVLIDGAEKESSGVTSRAKDGKMHHAERNAIASHLKRFGSIGPDAIMVTTLSPCCHDLKDRAGAACTDLLKKYGIKRVWAGYQDPAQHPHEDYPFVMEVTNNPDIFRACKDRYQEFAGGHLAAQLAEQLSQFKENDAVAPLFEINMGAKNLRSLAKAIDARAGMEFEMIVPNIGTEESEPEYEPDWDQDQRTRRFSDVRDFFHDGDYNGRRAVDDLMDELQGEYEEWIQEKTAESWESEGVDFMRDFVDVNDLFDRDEAMDQARDEVMTTNPDLPPESEDFSQLLSARLDELQEQFVLEAFEDKGSIYDDAFEKFADERREEYDEGSFLDEKYSHMTDIQSNFDISWPHYYDINDGQDGDMDIDQVADEFSSYMGKPINASKSYHGARREPGHYVVEPDGSLEGDNPGDAGLEFVSPPMPLGELLIDLNKVKKWAKRKGCYTNDSTGLHINVSVPGLKDINDLDYVKLAVLLGDQYVLNLFGRSGNHYCQPAIEKIKTLIKDKPQAAEKLLDTMKSGLNKLAAKAIHDGSTQKFTSINTKTGYVEFRSPGGDWLDENFEQIETTLLRMVVALDAAVDDDKYKQEYAKKLYKLLEPSNDSTDTIKYFSKFAAGELPQAALRSFVKQAQLERKLKKDPTGGKKYWWSVGRPGYGASVEVIAASKEEAIEKGKKEYPEWDYAQDMTAKPLRPYEEPTTPLEPGSTDTGNWGVWVPSLSRYATIGNAGPRRFSNQAAAQAWIQDYNSRHSRNDLEIVAREIEPGSSEPTGVDTRVPYEIYNRDTGGVAVGFLARNDDEALARLDVYRNSHVDASYGVRRGPGVTNAQTNSNSLRPTGPGPWELASRTNNQVYFNPSSTNRQVAEAEARAWLMGIGLSEADFEVRTREGVPQANDAAQGGIIDIPLDIELASPRPGSTTDLQQQRAQGGFTGAWKVMLNGQEVHRFSGIGNSQADANRVAANWLRQNGQGVSGEGFEVLPIMGNT